MDTGALRVAIVEDDAIMAFLLHEICLMADCDVVGTAASAIEARKLIRRTQPDCLILDYKLEGLENGLELLGEAKRAAPGMFTILITAWDINDIASRMESHRPDRILRKPVLPHLVIELLESLTIERIAA